MNKIKKDLICFWADNREIARLTRRFYKNHWKGYLVVCGVTTAICMAPFLIECYNQKKNDSKKEDQAKN